MFLPSSIYVTGGIQNNMSQDCTSMPSMGT